MELYILWATGDFIEETYIVGIFADKDLAIRWRDFCRAGKSIIHSVHNNYRIEQVGLSNQEPV